MAIKLDDVLLKLLTHMPLLRGFGRQELINLIHLGQKHEFAPEDVVFQEGDRGEFIYLVLAGQFRVDKLGPDGHTQHLADIRPGEHFGEMAMIGGHERTATVVCTARAVTLRFQLDTLLHHPEVAIKLYQNIARLLSLRLRKTSQDLVLSNTLRELETHAETHDVSHAETDLEKAVPTEAAPNLEPPGEGLKTHAATYEWSGHEPIQTKGH